MVNPVSSMVDFLDVPHAVPDQTLDGEAPGYARPRDSTFSFLSSDSLETASSLYECDLQISGVDATCSVYGEEWPDPIHLFCSLLTRYRQRVSGQPLQMSSDTATVSTHVHVRLSSAG